MYFHSSICISDFFQIHLPYDSALTCWFPSHHFTCVSPPSLKELPIPLYVTDPVLHLFPHFLPSLFLQPSTLLSYPRKPSKCLFFLLKSLKFHSKATIKNYQMTTSALWPGKKHCYIKKSYWNEHSKALVQPALYSVMPQIESYFWHICDIPHFYVMWKSSKMHLYHHPQTTVTQ